MDVKFTGFFLEPLLLEEAEDRLDAPVLLEFCDAFDMIEPPEVPCFLRLGEARVEVPCFLLLGVRDRAFLSPRIALMLSSSESSTKIGASSDPKVLRRSVAAPLLLGVA